MRRIAYLLLLCLSAGSAIAAANQSQTPPDNGGHGCDRQKSQQTTS